jgi:hypothetical protein
MSSALDKVSVTGSRPATARPFLIQPHPSTVHVMKVSPGGSDRASDRDTRNDSSMSGQSGQSGRSGYASPSGARASLQVCSRRNVVPLVWDVSVLECVYVYVYMYLCMYFLVIVQSCVYVIMCYACRLLFNMYAACTYTYIHMHVHQATTTACHLLYSHTHAHKYAQTHGCTST